MVFIVGEELFVKNITLDKDKDYLRVKRRADSMDNVGQLLLMDGAYSW